MTSSSVAQHLAVQENDNAYSLVQSLEVVKEDLIRDDGALGNEGRTIDIIRVLLELAMLWKKSS